MAHLSLSLLGPFQATLDGDPVTGFPTEKVQALLAYLAVESDRLHRREKLAGLLWPERPERRARQSLSQALFDLRRVIGDRLATPPFLLVTPQMIQFNRSSDHWVDVATFTGLLTACENHHHGQLETCESCMDRLQRAAALYRGRFLEGLSVEDSPAFEEWALLEGERLHQAAAEALHCLADGHEQRGEYEQALRCARRQLELDPWRERAHRQAMRALALSGQRSAALAQYEACRQTLVRELGVEPSERIQELYELLQKGEPLPGLPTLVPMEEREPRLVGPCPYRGLAAFREQDAPFFFGREDFTARLVEAVRERPLVAVVVGSSGSGKSSAVFAGLLPVLREEGDWLVVDFRPGREPFHSLAASLLPLLEPDLAETDRLIQTGKLAGALREGDVPLHEVVARVLEQSSRTERLLLVADQFEELYALCPEPEERRRFLDELLATAEVEATSRTPTFVLLLTIRADFLGQALMYRPFADVLQESALIIGPMTRDEMRRAIEKPAEKQGAAFEAGLTARILGDVGEEPGNLPLLEFALTLLWERQEGGWMTHAGYEEIGRVDGALAHYADEVVESLAEGERAGARRVFLQLVRPGEGTADTRRLATRTDMGEGRWPLVQHLADRRLVVTGRDAATGNETVEVVHEALIQGWERLRAWLEEDRAFRTWQERLRAALRGWEVSGEDEGALLRGVSLVEAERWLEERGEELSPAEQAFIQASRGLWERRQAERERRRQRVVGGLAIGMVITLVLTGFALIERRQALESYSYSLAANAQGALGDRDTATGLALALAANDINDPPAAAQQVLMDAAFAPGPRRRFNITDIAPGVSGLPSSVAIGPDGRTVLTGLTDGTIVLWDLESGAEVSRLVGHDVGRNDLRFSPGGVNDVAFSPDGAIALSGADDGSLILWEVATGREIHRLSGHSETILAVDISPDGRTGVSGGSSAQGAELILWDLETGREIRRFEGYTEGEPTVEGLAFSPDGRTVLVGTRCTGGASCTLRLWDVGTGEQRQGFDVSTMSLRDVAISPDGATALTASANYLVELWDLVSGGRLETFDGHGYIVTQVAYTLDGRRALSGGKTNGSVFLWNLHSGEQAAAFQVHTDSVTGIALSPDGRAALSSSLDGSLILWDLVGAGEVRRLEGHTSSVTSVAYTPDGKRLLSSAGLSIRPFLAEEYVVRLWDLETGAGQPIHTFEGHTDSIFDMDVSPNGRTALTGSADRTVRLWDLETGDVIHVLEGHAGWVTGVSLDPGGRTAISGDWEGKLIWWDLEAGQPIRSVEAHSPERVLGVDISPDGRTVFSAGDGGAFLWDVETGELIRQMEGSPATSLIPRFSPDGGWAISTSWQDGAFLWDVATGKLIRHLEPEAGGTIWKPAFSPDGRTALFGGGDDTVVLWDLGTGDVIRRYTGHATLGIWGAAISPDGRTGVTCGEDFRIIEWELAVPSLDELREWVGANRYVRDMTCDERETYSIEPLCEE